MDAKEDTEKEVTFDFNKGRFLFKFFDVGFHQTRVDYWLIMSFPPVNQLIPCPICLMRDSLFRTAEGR